MVVYTMNERTRLKMDMESLLDSDNAPASREAGPRIKTLADARGVAEKIRARVRYDILGRDDVVELVLIAMFADGHVLLEDYPGSGKTTLAKSLGESILSDKPRDGLAEFRRLQFTPDLLPSDITGVMIFDPKTSKFHFRRGPIFAYVVLVDEINRTSPKVQAALLECMAESQVTVDNVSYQLDDLFFVMATQNPIDSLGTYPLPIAQLDRFLFKIRMEHVTRDAELQVLEEWGQPRSPSNLPRVFRGDVVESRAILRRDVVVSSTVRECLVDIARRVREDSRTTLGISTRSLVQAIPALQARAMIRGRDFVSGEDIEQLIVPLFHHRIALLPGSGEPSEVVIDAAKQPLEALNRATLKA